MPNDPDLLDDLAAASPFRQVWQAAFELDFPHMGPKWARFSIILPPDRVQQHYKVPEVCGTALCELYITYEVVGPVDVLQAPGAWPATKGGWLQQFGMVPDATLASLHRWAGPLPLAGWCHHGMQQSQCRPGALCWFMWMF